MCQCFGESLCDFTGAKLYYNNFFLLRVRANTSQQNSSWVQIRFCPNRHGELSVCVSSLSVNQSVCSVSVSQ